MGQGELLPEAVVEACRAPIDRARTLPRQAFTSPAFLALERDRIFSKRWIAVLFEDEVAHVGDARPFELVDVPLVAIRAGDGVVRVFHNICPYDGCPVVLQPRRHLKEIEAPYHGWRYDLLGKLQAIPYWTGKEDTPLTALKGKPGDLAAVQTESWNGIVFVNLSDSGDSFGSAIAPLERLLSDYRLDDIAVGVRADGTADIEEVAWHANWKTVCENVCLNVLHENFVHASYRASSKVPRVDDTGNPTFFTVRDGQLMGFGFSYHELEETYGNLTFPQIGRNKDDPPKTGYYLAFYPSLNVSVWSNAIECEISLPVSPGVTRISAANFFEGGAATDPKLADERRKFSEMFEHFIAEDRRVVEAVQKGRQSPVYEQQYFSAFWDENHYNLTQLILDDLVGAAR